MMATKSVRLEFAPEEVRTILAGIEALLAAIVRGGPGSRATESKRPALALVSELGAFVDELGKVAAGGGRSA
jgi:hypothetical protein